MPVAFVAMSIFTNTSGIQIFTNAYLSLTSQVSGSLSMTPKLHAAVDVDGTSALAETTKSDPVEIYLK